MVVSGASVTPTITNVETVNLSFGLGATGINISKVSGATQIVAKSNEAGSTTATFTGVKTGNTFVVDNAIKTVAITTNSATATDEAATVTLQGNTATLTTNATNDIDQLTIKSTGAANVVTLGTVADVFSATGEKIVVTGDKDLTIKTAATANANGLDDATVEKSLTGGALLTVEYTGALDSVHDLSKVAADVFVFSGAVADDADVTVASGSTVRLANTQAITDGGDFTDDGDNQIRSKTENGTLNLNAKVSQTANILELEKFSTVNLSVTDTVAINNLTLLNAATLNDAKLNITGTDSTKTLTLTSVTAKEIDASAYEGKLVITANAQANAKITLGKNNDTIADLGNVDGVQVIATAGNNEITLTNAKAVTVTGGTGNDTIKVDADTDFLGTLDGGSGTNTIAFVTAAGYDVSANTVSFTNFQLIDVTATNGASVFSGAQLTGKSLNIVGAGGNDTVDVGATGGTAAVAIDLSNINHSGLSTFTVYTSDKADQIKGSKGADIINNEGGADSIDLSAGGADAVTLTVNKATAGTKIIGFQAGDTSTVTGADTIAVGANTTATAALNDLRETKIFTKGAGAGEFADLAAVLATFATSGANETDAKYTYIFNFDSKTYALVDGGTDGYAAANDIVVEITGFSGTLHASNFLTVA